MQEKRTRAERNSRGGADLPVYLYPKKERRGGPNRKGCLSEHSWKRKSRSVREPCDNSIRKEAMQKGGSEDHHLDGRSAKELPGEFSRVKSENWSALELIFEE